MRSRLLLEAVGMDPLVEELQAIIDDPEGFKWKGVDVMEVDITTFSEEDLIKVTCAVMCRGGLLKKHGIDAKTWALFMNRVKELMQKNPYHNFLHICDVMQTVGVILSDPSLNDLFTDLDRLTILTAAVVHDLNHPGKNNAYQVSAGTDLAILYNDISVLENHHCAISSKLFNEVGLFASFTPEQRKGMRAMTIQTVLATDMAKHFALSGELGGYLKDNEKTDDNAKKTLLMKSVLHVADISNPFKIWDVSKFWSDRVIAEFFDQGDVEKAQGLPVSPMCDRVGTKQDESSLGFCDFIVAPYLFTCAAAFPTVLLPCVKTLGDNREIWHDMLVNRINADESLDEGAKKKALETWAGKRDGFKTKMNAVIESIQLPN
mgnify:CR=1 FL=1